MKEFLDISLKDVQYLGAVQEKVLSIEMAIVKRSESINDLGWLDKKRYLLDVKQMHTSILWLLRKYSEVHDIIFIETIGDSHVGPLDVDNPEHRKWIHEKLKSRKIQFDILEERILGERGIFKFVYEGMLYHKESISVIDRELKEMESEKNSEQVSPSDQSAIIQYDLSPEFFHAASLSKSPDEINEYISTLSLEKLMQLLSEFDQVDGHMSWDNRHKTQIIAVQDLYRHIDAENFLHFLSRWRGLKDSLRDQLENKSKEWEKLLQRLPESKVDDFHLSNYDVHSILFPVQYFDYKYQLIIMSVVETIIRSGLDSVEATDVERTSFLSELSEFIKLFRSDHWEPISLPGNFDLRVEHALVEFKKKNSHPSSQLRFRGRPTLSSIESIDESEWSDDAVSQKTELDGLIKSHGGKPLIEFLTDLEPMEFKNFQESGYNINFVYRFVYGLNSYVKEDERFAANQYAYFFVAREIFRRAKNLGYSLEGKDFEKRARNALCLSAENFLWDEQDSQVLNYYSELKKGVEILLRKFDKQEYSHFAVESIERLIGLQEKIVDIERGIDLIYKEHPREHWDDYSHPMHTEIRKKNRKIESKQVELLRLIRYFNEHSHRSNCPPIAVDLDNKLIEPSEHINSILTFGAVESTSGSIQKSESNLMADGNKTTFEEGTIPSTMIPGMAAKSERERTKDVVSACYAEYQSRKPKPKRGELRTIANRHVKSHFPELKGRALQKKIDSVRKTYLKKVAYKPIKKKIS